MKKNTLISSLILLCLGVGLYTLVTWKWNIAIAAWLAPIFLIRYFRSQKHWVATLPAVLLLWTASYTNKFGVWGMDLLLEVAALGIAILPMVFALYLDRFASRRLPPFWAPLIFPAAYVVLDYGISFLPFGTVFSLSVSQFYIGPLIQLASVTGVWGIEFCVLWAAPVINAIWENGYDIRPVRVPAGFYAACLAAVLLLGGLRLVFSRSISPTVRVAGVSVAQARNYTDEIIDKGTPNDLVQALAPELLALQNQLFLESENAARSGAKVIFWSEVSAFIPPEQKAAFLQRSRDFARQHQVYFMPAYEVLRYGDTSGFNGLDLITPQGDVAFEYEKTKTWYATTSDGILHSIETPYGRIGAAICFDMDFPNLIRQAARQNVDIMLVPAFDTYPARVYHTEVSLLRGPEDGFSMFRMVNEGSSMAVDYRGQLLASQDFFTSPVHFMVADLPTRGVATLYGQLGDWFIWACVILTLSGMVWATRRPIERQMPVTGSPVFNFLQKN